jgi:hypothetical protein
MGHRNHATSRVIDRQTVTFGIILRDSWGAILHGLADA